MEGYTAILLSALLFERTQAEYCMKKNNQMRVPVVLEIVSKVLSPCRIYIR